MPAGLDAASDHTLKVLGKKLQAETVKSGCNATGSCPIPKTTTSVDGDASPPVLAAAPAVAAPGDTPRQEQQQQ